MATLHPIDVAGHHQRNSTYTRRTPQSNIWTRSRRFASLQDTPEYVYNRLISRIRIRCMYCSSYTQHMHAPSPLRRGTHPKATSEHYLDALHHYRTLYSICIHGLYSAFALARSRTLVFYMHVFFIQLAPNTTHTRRTPQSNTVLKEGTSSV